MTGSATATAYSLGQQLVITAWNIVFALVLVAWAFGWAGGKLLIEQTYADAKVKVAEQKEHRRAACRAQEELGAEIEPVPTDGRGLHDRRRGLTERDEVTR